MATVWCYRPKDPKVKKVVIEGLNVDQEVGVRSVGQPMPKLEKWVGKLVRVSILPNAAKTAEEQQKEKLDKAAKEALEQVDAGPDLEKHGEEPDLGDIDSPKYATLEEVMTMDFKELRDYAKRVGIQGSRSKESYIAALKEAGKIQS